MMKAIIGIKSLDGFFREGKDFARRLDAGEKAGEADFELSFATPAQLVSELSPKRMELLRVLKKSGPLSIRALAKAMGRNYSNVHADVRRLIEHGLIEKDAGDRVLVPWDDVVVRMDASLMRLAA
jgi:predicted transcriptional regulator